MSSSLSLEKADPFKGNPDAFQQTSQDLLATIGHLSATSARGGALYGPLAKPIIGGRPQRRMTCRLPEGPKRAANGLTLLKSVGNELA